MSATQDLSSPPPPPQDSPMDTQFYPIPPPPTTSLPIIDLSPFTSPSTPEARHQTALAINHACTTHGFFYLTGHGIPLSTLNTIISLARQFFLSSPLHEKMAIKRYDAGGPEGGDGARGYAAMGENITSGKRDVQEAVDFFREWDEGEKVEGRGGPGTFQVLQGPNLWPTHPAELKEVYEDYISQAEKVGEALVRAMGQALGLPPPSTAPDSIPTPETEDSEIFVRNTDKSFWVMRMIGYPPLSTPLSNTSTTESDLDQYSCGAHTDYGCTTLLLTDPTPGALQILLKDGTTWLPADPLPGAFVVNIGDMIERWTNGLWKSTRHRVIHRGEGYRVSVPFFFEPNFDARVKPLEYCVEKMGGKGEEYGESTYGEHLLGKVFNNFYSEVLGEVKEEKSRL